MGEFTAVPRQTETSRARRRACTTKVGLAALALMLATSASATTASASRKAGTINVGVIAPFSGSFAQLGKLISLSCYAAAQQINASSGILGSQVNCSTVDDTGDPADAVPAVARALATDNLSMATGLETNTAAVTVPTVNNASVPFFTANGLPAFDKTTDQYFWRIVPSDQQNGGAYAVWAKSKKYKRAAVVLQANAGNQTVEPGIVHALKKLGIAQAVRVDIPGDAASYASVVARVIRSKPDVIITADDPQTAATFFSQYKQQNHGVVPPLVTATDSLSPDYFKAMKKVLGLQFVTKSIALVGYHVNPASAAFAAYKTGLTTASQVAASDATVVEGIGVIAALYDGDIVMALAMTAANSTSASTWNAFIPKVTTKSATAVVVHSYAEGVAALQAHKTIDYVGTGGQISFNKYHNSTGNFSATGFNADGSPRLLGIFPGTEIAAALQ